MLGKHYLCAVVTQEAAKENWLTPQSGDVTGSTQDAVVMWANGQRPKTCDQRLRTQVAAEQLKHGQAAPASSSSLGSRQGLWPTASVPNGGQTTSGRADKYTKKQVRLEHAVKQWGSPAANDANKTPHCEVNSNQAGLAKSVGLELQRQWATPTPWQQEESLGSWETRKAKNKAKGYNGNGQGTPLDMQVKILGQAAPANWSTPRAQEDQSSVEAFNKRADAILARRKPTGGRQKPGLTQEVQMHVQAAPASPNTLGSRQGLSVDWRTPQAQEAGAKVETLFTKDGAPAMPGQRAYRKTPSGKLVLQSQTINQQVEMVQNWATPRANEMDGTRTPNGNPAKDGIPLGMQARQWGTPTARDHKSGRGNEQREYKELTPMVERRQTGKLNSQWVTQLMGLPMGWVSPSCPASVIKNWPRFVTGWLQATIAPTSCDSSGMALCQPAQS